METETRERPHVATLEMYRKQLEPMQLHCQARTDKVVLFRMKAPETGCMSTQITFTAAGIALQGDFTPTDYGTCSALGYGERWFASNLSGDYLCEKFLVQGYNSDLFKWDLSDPEMVEALGISEDQKRDALRVADDGRDGAAYLWDDGIYFDDWTPGWGYLPTQRAALCAIQERFRELHQELYGDQVPELRAPERQ